MPFGELGLFMFTYTIQLLVDISSELFNAFTVLQNVN